VTPAKLWRVLEKARQEVYGGYPLPWRRVTDPEVRRVYTIAAKILAAKA
jgi:hypothetical protein